MAIRVDFEKGIVSVGPLNQIYSGEVQPETSHKVEKTPTEGLG